MCWHKGAIPAPLRFRVRCGCRNLRGVKVLFPECLCAGSRNQFFKNESRLPETLSFPLSSFPLLFAAALLPFPLFSTPLLLLFLSFFPPLFPLFFFVLRYVFILFSLVVLHILCCFMYILVGSRGTFPCDHFGILLYTFYIVDNYIKMWFLYKFYTFIIVWISYYMFNDCAQ